VIKNHVVPWRHSTQDGTEHSCLCLVPCLSLFRCAVCPYVQSYVVRTYVSMSYGQQTIISEHSWAVFYSFTQGTASSGPHTLVNHHTSCSHSCVHWLCWLCYPSSLSTPHQIPPDRQSTDLLWLFNSPSQQPQPSQEMRRPTVHKKAYGTQVYSIASTPGRGLGAGHPSPAQG
jgi:hypothetical protein